MYFLPLNPFSSDSKAFLVCFLLLKVLHLPGSSAGRAVSEAESFFWNVNFGKDNSVNYWFMTLIGTCQGC